LIGRFIVEIEDAERKIHDVMKPFCVRGEWFESKAARDLLKLWRDTGTWTYKRDTVPVKEIKDRVKITTTEEQAAREEYNRPEVKAIWNAIDKAFRW